MSENGILVDVFVAPAELEKSPERRLRTEENKVFPMPPVRDERGLMLGTGLETTGCEAAGAVFARLEVAYKRMDCMDEFPTIEEKQYGPFSYVP